MAQLQFLMVLVAEDRLDAERERSDSWRGGVQDARVKAEGFDDHLRHDDIEREGHLLEDGGRVEWRVEGQGQVHARLACKVLHVSLHVRLCRETQSVSILVLARGLLDRLQDSDDGGVWLRIDADLEVGP